VSPRKKSKPTPRTRSPLYPLVLRASARVGTSQRLAELVGMSLSAMLRGAKTGQLSTDAMLAIAEVGGVDPLPLLRAAGKRATADRIQRLFGPAQPALTADERRLLALADEEKRQLCRLIKGLTD
jgi:acetyl-CoA carboxylase alpha subunit